MMKTILQKNLEKEALILKHLEDNLRVVCDVTELTQEEYTLIRRGSLGASDSSVLCDVNIYKSKEQLLAEKRSTVVTDEERAIGLKPAVMMGKELEPFVLNKFVLETGIRIIKPPFMYKHKTFNYLTFNYDGVACPNQDVITVEAKIVTRYGEKYYKKDLKLEKSIKVVRYNNERIKEHIVRMASLCGVPPYYYTQVQQQILGLDTETKECPYGYLAVLFIDSWTFKYYYIPRDQYTIAHIIAEGAKFTDRK